MHPRPVLRRNARRSAILAAVALLVAPLSAAHGATPVPTGVLTGVVTLAGQPVSGATVTVTALPGLDAPTGPFRQEPMASGTTSATGRFSIPLAVNQNIIDMANLNGDYVNYWVQAFYNDVEAADLDKMVWGGEGTAYTAADLAYSTLIDTGLTEPVSGAVGAVLSTPDTVTLELTAYEGADTVKMTSSGVARDGVNTACTTTVSVGNSACGTAGEGSSCESTYGPIITVVGRETNYGPIGEGHVEYDSTGTFSYGESANTDLDGAYSANGGPFKVTAGTSHMGNKSSTVTAAYTAGHASIQLSQFNYREERLDFTDDMGDGHVCRHDYRVIPEGWKGGGTTGADVRSHDSAGQMDAARGKGWATYYAPDMKRTYTKKTAKGERYKGSISAFGISLGAQSTWSTNVSMAWKFGTATDHWLYGSNGTSNDAENVYAW
jgi:hypothetical protein